MADSSEHWFSVYHTGTNRPIYRTFSPIIETSTSGDSAYIVYDQLDFLLVQDMLRYVLGELHIAKSHLGFISMSLCHTSIAMLEPLAFDSKSHADKGEAIANNTYFLNLSPQARFDSRYCGTHLDPDIGDLFLNVANLLKKAAIGKADPKDNTRRVAVVRDDQLSLAIDFFDLFAWVTNTEDHKLALLTESGALLDAEAARAAQSPKGPRTPVFARGSEIKERDDFTVAAAADRCTPMSAEQDIPLILSHPFFH